MAKHTRDSWGSLQYDAKRRKARIRYWAEGTDGYKRRSKTIRDCTRKEAEAARAQLMLEHGEDAPCPTVAQVWERWVLPEMERKVASGDMSKRSLTLYTGSYRREISDRWGKVPCDQVRPLAVQQWIDTMTYSQATYAVMLLKRTLGYAVRYECISANPMSESFVMPSKSTVKKRDDGVWTLPQLETIWRDVAYGQPWESAFLLSAFGGCRVGESLAAKVEDVSTVDVDGIQCAVVEIRRQASTSGLSDRLKTSWSYRPTVLVGRAATRLLELAESCDVWLAGDGVGGCCKRHQMRFGWDSAIKSVKADLRHPYKNLRNSWQTNMRWSLKIPPWIIEPMMGHVGEGTTGHHYDKPQAVLFAETLANAYREHPYDAGWTWLDEDR
ncbi:MAG: hypothetical protein IJ943_03740 [Akkermansia sp.]|nr:hypothetical protein [Akkermansia sp.]MBR3387491.1 hypothetical protein [Bacteroidales bacterium]